jgi:uncharacterized protein
MTILAVTIPPAELYGDPMLLFMVMIGMVAGTFPLAFAYISLFALLFQNEKWRRRMLVLAPIGRTALSNYLSQTLICLLVFYGFGLGLIGKIGVALGFPIAIAIYAIQIPVSRWWLGRFRFGPMEWLWRTLTYTKLQPMRAAAATAPHEPGTPMV